MQSEEEKICRPPAQDETDDGYFSNRSLVLLFFLLVGIMALAAFLISTVEGVKFSYEPGKHWPLATVVCQLIHASIIVALRPQSLRWSRWTVSALQLVASVLCGVLMGYLNRRIFGVDSVGTLTSASRI